MGMIDIFISYLKKTKNNNLIVVSNKQNELILKSNPPKNNNNCNPENTDKEIKIERNKTKNKSKIINIKKKKLFSINNNKSIKCINSSIPQNSYDTFNKSNTILEEKNKEIEQKINNEEEKNDINKNINIEIEEYLKTDLDDMDYDDAVRCDRRKFCQYFWEKMKTEQIILSTFFNQEILKPLPIKIILLILNIDLYLIINGLFFNENYMSDLLKSNDDNLISFISRILDRIVIITLTGIIINYIIEFFFVEESKIKKIFKREKENELILQYEMVQLIKNTYTKYNIFIIITCIIMIISLYYVFCFNNVYSSIKGEWIKSSIIIISIMQIFPILLYFLDTSIRFISFKCKSERLFKLSAILS